MPADERPEAATKRPSAFEEVTPPWRGPLVRQLVDDQAKRLDDQIKDINARRDVLSREVGELAMRRELLERISSLSDSMLERLVLELGAVVPGARTDG